MDGISALIKGTPENSLALFLPCKDTMSSHYSVTQERALTRTDHAGILILDF